MIAVRMEGGIGDHILGMRILEFIRRRYPSQEIHVYSDCGGYPAQLETVRMSPLVKQVIPVFKEPIRLRIGDSSTSLNALETKYLEQMLSADKFFDASTRSFFIEQARDLGVSHLDILRSRPELAIPADARAHATEFLPTTECKRIVTINLSKQGGGNGMRALLPGLRAFVNHLLRDRTIHILNVFAMQQDFPHYTELNRREAVRKRAEEGMVLAEFCREYEGVMTAVVDEPVTVIAALLSRTSYFLGVDNGIKHLAWALGTRLRYLLGTKPRDFVMQYCPDYFRALAVQGSTDDVREFELCAAEALQAQD